MRQDRYSDEDFDLSLGGNKKSRLPHLGDHAESTDSVTPFSVDYEGSIGVVHCGFKNAECILRTSREL